jgi:PEP-CTERM motif-containing protein
LPTSVNLTNAPAFGYRLFSVFGLLATGPSTALTFQARDDPGFFFLDDVAVNAAPEPSSLVLLGSGLAAVLLRARRYARRS